MKKAFTIIFTSAVIIISMRTASSQQINPGDSRQWYKADLHTHFTFHEPMEEDIQAYTKAGYQFLVMSMKDNDRLFKAEKYSTPEMLVVSGVEQAFLTRLNKLGHVLAFPIKSAFPFTTNWSVVEGYAKLRTKNPDVIFAINHPHDKRWSIEDVLDSWKDGVGLFELNSAEMKHGEFETELWDRALNAGAHLSAMLTNDMHSIQDVDAYGYILIRAETLSTDAIYSAIRNGDFMAVESGCAAKPTKYTVYQDQGYTFIDVLAPGAERIRVVAGGSKSDPAKGADKVDTIDFLGEAVIHEIDPDTLWIRAELHDSNSRVVFLQPFYLAEKEKEKEKE